MVTSAVSLLAAQGLEEHTGRPGRTGGCDFRPLLPVEQVKDPRKGDDTARSDRTSTIVSTDTDMLDYRPIRCTIRGVWYRLERLFGSWVVILGIVAMLVGSAVALFLGWLLLAFAFRLIF